jgi:hypothetical protein
MYVVRIMRWYSLDLESSLKVHVFRIGSPPVALLGGGRTLRRWDLLGLSSLGCALKENIGTPNPFSLSLFLAS